MNKRSVIVVLIGCIIFILGIVVGRFSDIALPFEQRQTSPENRSSLNSEGVGGHRSSHQKTRQFKVRADGKSLNAVQGGQEKQLSLDQKFLGVSQTAKEEINRLTAECESLDVEKLKSLFPGRLQHLKDFGEEGSQAILEFLETRKDVELEKKLWPFLGARVEVSSLRQALMDFLYEMEDPISQKASLKVLQNSSSDMEVFLAARNIEKLSPGIHRAEALQAVSEILARHLNPENPETPKALPVLEVVRYYQARETFPQMEELIKKQPEWAVNWAHIMDGFPAEDQADVLERLWNNDQTKPFLAKRASALSKLDFQNEKVRQLVSEVFSKEMSSIQKIQFFEDFESGFYGPYYHMDPSNRNRAGWESRIKANTKEDKLRMLDELAPYLDTPGLKQRYEKTRSMFQENSR